VRVSEESGQGGAVRGVIFRRERGRFCIRRCGVPGCVPFPRRVVFSAAEFDSGSYFFDFARGYYFGG
jgi:hypothetical protein